MQGIAGLFMAVAMTTGGGAWDTAGPAVSRLIEIINIVAPLIVAMII